jgi:hypothetical protein
MSKQKALALMVLMSVALLAGCSGILPGEESPTPTQTPGETPESTPSITPGMTPTVTPEPTPPATPVPPSENHQLFARQVGDELEKFRPGDEWVQKTEGHANNTISVYVEKPSEWSVKRTEMEAVREAVRGTVIGTTPNETEAESTEQFLRPETVYIHVRTKNQQLLTTITVDTGLAANYASHQISIETFAEEIAGTRKSQADRPKIDDQNASYYLKIAEWDVLKNEHSQIINQTTVVGTNETVDLDAVKIRPEKNEIYYEYTPPNASESVIREGVFTKSYWEAIRNVSRDRLIHRYPERMRVYANVPGDADMESSIRTEYAFDFLEITGGDISDENILTSGAWDAYYNKINRTYHEDS